MNPEWLKSISARVEGRNVIIVAALVFAGFGLWLFRDYDHHPWVSLGFLSAFFLLGAGAILIGLLKQPQPSEVAQKFLLQQIGQQVFYAGGLQSGTELIELLRAAHNVQPLPPPSALVVGSASNETGYKDVPESEAKELVRKDNEGVRLNLEKEAQRIKSMLGVKSLPANTLQPGQRSPSGQLPTDTPEGAIVKPGKT